MPFVFKYFGIISLPLFLVIAFWCIRQTEGHQLHKHSISKSILFLKNPFYRLIFRLNFVLKSLLDFLFLLYIKDHLQLSFTSPAIITLGIAIALFALLSLVIEGSTHALHLIIIYAAGVIWAISNILMALYIAVNWFTLVTYVMASIPWIIGFGALFLRRITVYVQLVCIVFIYSWTMLFVLKFL